MPPTSFQNPSDAVIVDILSHPKRVAVVGCSPDPSRDSHRIARLLLEKGHAIVPVNPNADTVLGLPCYASLTSIPDKVDMVDIFRRSSEVAPIVDQAIAIGARIIWMQLGVIDEQAGRRATDAGLTVVMDRCPAIEYRRLLP